MKESTTSVARFKVTLPTKARAKVNVPYATKDGTAKAGADYRRTAGRLAFRRGQRTKIISVRILDDALDEPAETFTLRLRAVRRVLRAQTATATIVDDDPGVSPTAPIAALPGPGQAPGVDTGGTSGGVGATPTDERTAPTAEICNGADDDQDGATDEGVCVVSVAVTGSGRVTSSPAGISCPPACTASLGPQGTSVTLTATPAGGHDFSGWGGDCSGTSTCHFGSGDRSVTATFASALAVGQLVFNEIFPAPASPDGDANGNGTVNSTDDEFVEILNASARTLDLGGATLSDGTIRHTFPTPTLVASGCAVVVFGGTPGAGTFGGAAVQTAGTGTLNLNNTGETVTLAVGGSHLASATYPSSTTNVSFTRDPDGAGSSPFVLHNAASGSSTNFSPGTRVTAAPFAGC